MAKTFLLARTPLWAALLLALAARAQPPASAAAAAKDIVIDRPAAAMLAPPSAQETVTAAALAELGLELLRQPGAQADGGGAAPANALVSPLSLAAALGLLQAGTAGSSARELDALLGRPGNGRRIFTAGLPALLEGLAPAGEAGGPLRMANRLWIDAGVLSAVPPDYAATVQQRFKADAAIVSFAQATAARRAINGWVAERTAQRIPELMPAGSLGPTTKLVLSNAIHFKSPWAQPFDAALTVPRPFKRADGALAVPTMIDERVVRQARVDGALLMELPFAGEQFSLLIGLPPEGQALSAFAGQMAGLDLAAWHAQLQPLRCRLELPKFSIAPASRPLKSALQTLGVKTVFGPAADLSPMLGRLGRSVHLDNVYQSAAIVIDEQGGEAAAATGAAVQAKSLAPLTPPVPACAVDRPFVFALMHRASGTPLFIGQLLDPGRP